MVASRSFDKARPQTWALTALPETSAASSTQRSRKKRILFLAILFFSVSYNETLLGFVGGKR